MDNLLVYLIQSFNNEAFDILFDKYMKYSQMWAKEILKNGGYRINDYDLLECDLVNNLYRVFESYDSSKGIFYSYAKSAVYFTVRNFLRDYLKVNSNTFSLNNEIEDNILLVDILSSEDNMSKIVERYYFIEEVETFFNKIDLFNDSDKKVILLKMQGYSIDEISRMTELNVRRINYIVAKLKKM